MSVLTPGAFSAHSAFLPWLKSKEANDSVLIDGDSLFFSTKGAFTKTAGGGRYLKASISQQVSQGSTATEVHSLRKGPSGHDLLLWLNWPLRCTTEDAVSTRKRALPLWRIGHCIHQG